MDLPDNLAFTGLDVPVDSLFRRGQRGPMHRDWTRVQFDIPDPHDAVKSVEQWLYDNCAGRWETYGYQSPRGVDNQYIMVVRFEARDDALLFKLRGGHQAWQPA